MMGDGLGAGVRRMQQRGRATVLGCANGLRHVEIDRAPQEQVHECQRLSVGQHARGDQRGQDIDHRVPGDAARACA